MRNRSLRLAAWQPHARAVRASAPMHDWLITPGSLTARLVASSDAFRVRRLHQHGAVCLADEAAAIGLARPQRVWEREVLLVCDGTPVVFAHTVVPPDADASDWPLFSALGERSLGSTLFYDPLVRRGSLEFARLGADHPLVRRAHAAIGGARRPTADLPCAALRLSPPSRPAPGHRGILAGGAQPGSGRNHEQHRIIMNVFFEESGDFKVGAILSQAGEAYQVELASGKRTKVKTRDVLLQFEKPAPQELMDAARAVAADVDLEFLWEVAGEEEFGFAELGAEYFGHAPLPHEAAGLVLTLHGSPDLLLQEGPWPLQGRAGSVAQGRPGRH